MDAAYVGRCLRVLRVRAGLRQVDLARRVGVSQQLVSKAEQGRLEHLSVGALERLFRAAGAGLDIRPIWRGAAIDRLLDGVHAALVSATIAYLQRLSFRGVPEVSYARWGERGSIDVLGISEERAAVIVTEVKSEVASVEETLRRHDAKVRLAPDICQERWGWRPRAVSRLLVLPDSSTARRQVAAGGAALVTALPGRAVGLRAWARSPVGPWAGVLFLPFTPGSGARDAVRPIVRVRAPQARGRAASDRSGSSRAPPARVIGGTSSGNTIRGRG